MLLLRPATLHDLPALHDIERSATELYYEAGFSPTHVDPRSEADMRLLLKYTTVLLALEDDEPIGYASFYTRGPFMHLEEIAVRRDRQRRGCGRALALQALEVAQADPQCTHLSLVTFTGARWAVELYSGLGFEFLTADASVPQIELLQEIIEIEAAAGRASEARVPMIRAVRPAHPTEPPVPAGPSGSP